MMIISSATLAASTIANCHSHVCLLYLGCYGLHRQCVPTDLSGLPFATEFVASRDCDQCTVSVHPPRMCCHAAVPRLGDKEDAAEPHVQGGKGSGRSSAA